MPANFFGRALELLAALVGEAAHVDASDVDAERKIVLEEWRQGKDWAQRSAGPRPNQQCSRADVGDAVVAVSKHPSRLK